MSSLPGAQTLYKATSGKIRWHGTIQKTLDIISRPCHIEPVLVNVRLKMDTWRSSFKKEKFPCTTHTSDYTQGYCKHLQGCCLTLQGRDFLGSMKASACHCQDHLKTQSCRSEGGKLLGQAHTVQPPSAPNTML